MLKVLLWIWQLPQNILGAILTIGASKCAKLCYFRPKLFYSGVSLGNYIIFDARCAKYIKPEDIRHEQGHQSQSKYLGPLYLLVIGLPSLLGNIYSRLFHKSEEWYYAQPWEAWADKLGNVHR